MSIIKLPKDGDEATFTVTKCERVEGQYGPQVLFGGADGEQLYLPADSADRQLGRVFDFTAENGVAYGQVIAERLRFFRTANTKKAGAAPYWNIEIATGPAKPAPKRLTGPLDGPRANPRPVSIPAHDPMAPPATEPPDELWGDRDAGYAEDYPAKAVEIPMPSAGIEARIAAYFLLAQKVATFQAELGKTHEMPWDGQSVNAMTFSIWNSRGTQ